MKKIVQIFFALIVFLGACKLGIHEEYGTVVLNIAGSSSTARAIGANGLPELDGMALEVELQGSLSGKQRKRFSASEAKHWTVKLPVGDIVTIRVRATGGMGIWSGMASITVRSGINTVSVSLDKRAVGLLPLGFSFAKEKDSSGTGDDIYFELKNNEQQIVRTEVASDNAVPSFCRDSKGRIYIAYEKEISGGAGSWGVLERYNSDGSTAGTVTMNRDAVVALASDLVTGTTYILTQEHLTGSSLKLQTVIEKGASFELSTPFGSGLNFSAQHGKLLIAAIHDGQLFVCGYKGSANNPELFVYSINGTQLEAERKLLTPKNPTDVYTDMLIKDGHLYLLAQNYNGESTTDNPDVYSRGSLTVYGYDKNTKTLTAPQTFGSSHKPAENHIISTPEDCFYGPVKFVGFEDTVLYIADDGVVFKEKNGRPVPDSNKNRRATFDTATRRLDFSTVPFTWVKEVKSQPDSPSVVSEKTPFVFFTADGNKQYRRFVVADTVSTPISGTEIAELKDKSYTDGSFTFDKDGNLYIIYTDHASGGTIVRKLVRFAKTPTGYTQDSSFNSGTTQFKKVLYDRKEGKLYALSESGEIYWNDQSAWKKIPLSAGTVGDGRVCLYGGMLYELSDAAPFAVKRYKYENNSFTPILGIPAILDAQEQPKDMYAGDGKLYLLYTSQNSSVAYIKPVDISTETPLIKSAVSVPLNISEGNSVMLTHLQYIGFADKSICFAIDGVEKENDRVKRNINMLARFDGTTVTSADVSAAGITWLSELPVWQGTKIIVWKPNTLGSEQTFNYYLVDKPEDSLPSAAVLKSNSMDDYYTDQFCYDQAGNFYVMKYKHGRFYMEQYILQEDGSYDFSDPAAGGRQLELPLNTNAFAVDLSGKQLYCSCKSSSHFEIQRMKWTDQFGNASAGTSQPLLVNQEQTVTALAADKTGVYVAVKTLKNQETTTEAYSLEVQKYQATAFDGSGGAFAPVGVVSICGSTSSNKYKMSGSVLTASPDSYVVETINALHIQAGTVYAVTTKQVGKQFNASSEIHYHTKGSMSGKLLSLGKAEHFSNASSVESIYSSEPSVSAPEEDIKKGGEFAPYRFIAVKPKELVIASDGYCGWQDSDGDHRCENFNFVWMCKIETDPIAVEKKAVSSSVQFSQEASSGCGFSWN